MTISLRHILFISLSIILFACESQPSSQAFKQVPIINKAPKETSRPLSTDTMYDLILAELALRRGASDQAVELYLEQAEIQQDPSIAANATKLAHTLELYETAVKACNIWLTLDSGNFEAISLKTIALLHLRQTNQAFLLLEQSVNNLDTSLFTHLALTSTKQSQHHLLLNHYNQLLKHPHAHNHLNLRLGTAYLHHKLNNNQEALNHIDKALKHGTESIDAILLQTEILHAQGAPNALDKIKKVLKDRPDDHLAFDKALDLLSRIAPDTALEILNPLLKKQAKPYMLLRLAKANIQLKRLRNARIILERLLLSPGYQTQVNYLLGLIKRKQGKPQAAVAHLQAAQEKTFLIPATEALVSALIALNQQDNALRQFPLARKKANKPSAKLHLFLLESSLRHQFNDYEGALQTFNIALIQFPNNLQILYNRALISLDNNRGDLAIEDLNTILNIDPRYSPALNALAYIYAQNNTQLSGATQLINRALQITPDNPEYLDTKGWIAFLQGNMPAATQYLQRAYQKKKDPTIAAHLGEALWANKQKEKALEIWQEARILFPNNPIINDVLKRLHVYPQLQRLNAPQKTYNTSPNHTDFDFNFD